MSWSNSPRDRRPFDNLLALGELLEAALGKRVELVTAESLSPYLRPYILAEAQDVLRAARVPATHRG